ncbi:MFS transporter [Shimia abyssi]|uniref:Putative MFS family arabinose efflux permease n=1 Tax=Shimia abyssi TaxID=1662395 RepID=A0A2P8FAB3_9RHOB|nr:MFS transporter [Shimia abyssi]PSL18655.1 putative MFS family arabinose efflux permease [Shimia abyssi]
MNLAALSSANFRNYVSGSMFALLAIWMQRVTMGWIAWDMTGTSSFVGLVAFVQFAPAIVLSPLFGVWVDRLDVRRVTLVIQFVNLLVALAFVLFYVLGWLTPLTMVALTLASGVALAANHPTRMSLSVRLVPKEMVSSVVTIVAINFNVARTLGPALGGLIIARWGVAAALITQAALLLPFIVQLFRLKVRPRRSDPAEDESFLAALHSGFSYVWQNVVTWRAMVIGGVVALVGRGVLEILPPLADGVFQRGPEGLGVLMTATGIGAVFGGFFKAMLPPQAPGRIPRVTLIAILLGLLLVSALGAAPNWTAALLVAAAIAFVTTLSAISMQTAIQMELEDDMRGRVMSLWAVVVAGGGAIGAWALGISADLVGYQEALIVVGFGSTLLLGGYLAMTSRNR